MIRVGITFVQVITLEEMKSEEIIKVSQDKNRKQMLLLATIYAIIMKILFILIY